MDRMPDDPVMDLNAAPDEVRLQAESEPRQCAGCGLWISKGGKILMLKDVMAIPPPEALAHLVPTVGVPGFYYLCAVCGTRVSNGEGAEVIENARRSKPRSWGRMMGTLDDAGNVIPRPEHE